MYYGSTIIRTVREWLPSVTMPGSTLPILCIDIDECLGTNGCQQTCENNQGSYTCNCTNGFQLAADGKSCNGSHMTFIQSMCSCNIMKLCSCFPVLVECATSPSCSQICAEVGLEEQCYCSVGYEIDEESGSQCFGMSSVLHYKTRYFGQHLL